MNEEKTQEANDKSASGERAKVPTENTGDRVSSEQVGKVRKDLDELRQANDEVEKELLRKEELRARMALGGQTDAGQGSLTPEEAKNAEAQKMADEISGAFK